MTFEGQKGDPTPHFWGRGARKNRFGALKTPLSGQKGRFLASGGPFFRLLAGLGRRGRKWGHLGEKIDLQTLGPEMGSEGRGS